jgi:hypothetical protein
MREGHMRQIERWAEYVKNHKDWKKEQKKLIDSQIIMARRIYSKLSKTEEGRKKIKELKKL